MPPRSHFLVALGCLIAGWASGAEQLQNGGFDDWNAGLPSNWEKASTCVVTQISIGDGNSAVQLGSGSSSETQALLQTFPSFGGGFSFSILFSQSAPTGGLRGMNVSIRSSSSPLLSFRSSATGTLEVYDGSSASWVTIAGTGNAILPSNYADGNNMNDPLYRVEIDGDFTTARYSIRLYDASAGTLIASAAQLSYWQTAPLSSATLRAVHLERGRSGADWRAYEASLDQLGSEEEPFVVNPNPSHPFLIVSAAEFPAWREKALHEPWATVKAKAISTAGTLVYDPAFSGPYRSKVLRLKTVVSACALSSILDPANASTYADKAAAQMVAGLTDIRNTRGAIGGWDANTPVGSTLFSCILALDVLHPSIAEPMRLQIEGLIGPMANSLSGWNPSPESVRSLWALYRGDAAAYQTNVSAYLSALLNLFTDDGVMLAGTGYGNARLNYYDREQKHALTDVLSRLGAMDAYSIRKIQRVYEWLYGSAYGHQGELHIFGDTSANRPLWGPPGEYPQDSPTAAYRAWHYSAAAQSYANRLIADPAPQASLLGYALLGTPTRDLPATNAPSRIFRDGGAFFREDTMDPGGLSSGLLNLTRSETHTHKEVNSISLIGHGEHLVSNSGYAGAGTASLGYSWSYINDRAVSANTVLIDYPLTSAAGATSTGDHLRKHGAGISRGLIAPGFDYAVGDSGTTLAAGNHQRGMAFLHPEPALGTPGYWLLFDRVTSTTGTNAQMALHPFSSDVSTVAANQHYRWFIRKATQEGTYLSIHLTSPPSQTQILNGVLANLDSSKSFVGKFLYATYPIQAGTAHFATALLPHRDPADEPLANHSSGAGYREMTFQWNTVEDHLFTADTASAPQVAGSISWTGSACHVRAISGAPHRFFIDQGTSFTMGGVEFSSSVPVMAVGTSHVLTVSVPSQASLTFRWPGVFSGYLGHSSSAINPDAFGRFSLSLPAGEHRITFGTSALPELLPQPMPETVILGIRGLQPGKPYRYEASSDLSGWESLKEGTATSSADFIAEPGPVPARRFYRIVLPQNP